MKFCLFFHKIKILGKKKRLHLAPKGQLLNNFFHQKEQDVFGEMAESRAENGRYKTIPEPLVIPEKKKVFQEQWGYIRKTQAPNGKIIGNPSVKINNEGLGIQLRSRAEALSSISSERERERRGAGKEGKKERGEKERGRKAL